MDDDQKPGIEPAPSIELWAGVECTVNRVRDAIFDQLKRGGHFTRLADLQLIEQLGVKAVRYPVLWEHAQSDPNTIDLSWASERLETLRASGIRPIAGLVHHGSGPVWTSLCDDDFPFLLARYARHVANAFPWIEEYTPINEPLTTARFSALYGHWYPHGRCDELFVRALLNQCRATVLAMQQIRRVSPTARLIQTEDAARIHSTPKLRYQAAFENERRWLSFDLLCGRVKPDHYLWKYLIRSGARPDELLWFSTQDMNPMILGLNYYVTSERYLDDAVDRYPEYLRGSNGRHRYADVEAIRVRLDSEIGIDGRFAEAHERYGLPIAVTECHIGCHRESQLHWLKEVWMSAHRAFEQGIDIRAVTSWSIFGSHNWNSLVTEDSDHYESGAFDVRSNPPRPTAVSQLLTSLNSAESFDHPVLAITPWWKRENRFFHSMDVDNQPTGMQQAADARPLLIVGDQTATGKAFIAACARRSIPFIGIYGDVLDEEKSTELLTAIRQYQPWGVIDALTHVKGNLERCSRNDEIILGMVKLTQVCADSDIAFLTFSSDDVFDGNKNSPYTETDTPNPVCHLGRFQRLYDEIVHTLSPHALVIRTGPLMMPGEQSDLLSNLLTSISRGIETRVSTDWIVSPTYLPDLVDCSLDLLIDKERGMWHLSNRGYANWREIAEMAATASGIESAPLMACSASEFCRRLAFPRQSALCSERGSLLPTLEDSICRFGRDFRMNGTNDRCRPAEQVVQCS